MGKGILNIEFKIEWVNSTGAWKTAIFMCLDPDLWLLLVSTLVYPTCLGPKGYGGGGGVVKEEHKQVYVRI
jgi:hypothetical protein